MEALWRMTMSSTGKSAHFVYFQQPKSTLLTFFSFLFFWCIRFSFSYRFCSQSPNWNMCLNLSNTATSPFPWIIETRSSAISAWMEKRFPMHPLRCELIEDSSTSVSFPSRKQPFAGQCPHAHAWTYFLPFFHLFDFFSNNVTSSNPCSFACFSSVHFQFYCIFHIINNSFNCGLDIWLIGSGWEAVDRWFLCVEEVVRWPLHGHHRISRDHLRIVPEVHSIHSFEWLRGKSG